MNTVGPYHNRQEVYSYYSLPFCAGPKKAIAHYHETLGEALLGVELEFSGYELDYKTDKLKTIFCEVALSEEKVDAFLYAVRNQYWYDILCLSALRACYVGVILVICATVCTMFYCYGLGLVVVLVE